MARTIAEIQNEYNQTCGELGHLSFQRELLLDQMLLKQKKLRELDLEASELVKASKEEKKENE